MRLGAWRVTYRQSISSLSDNHCDLGRAFIVSVRMTRVALTVSTPSISYRRFAPPYIGFYSMLAMFWFLAHEWSFAHWIREGNTQRWMVY